MEKNTVTNKNIINDIDEEEMKISNQWKAHQPRKLSRVSFPYKE